MVEYQKIKINKNIMKNLFNEINLFSYSKYIWKVEGPKGGATPAETKQSAEKRDEGMLSKILGEKAVDSLKQKGVEIATFLKKVIDANDNPWKSNVKSPAMLKLFAESDLEGLNIVAARLSSNQNDRMKLLGKALKQGRDGLALMSALVSNKASSKNLILAIYKYITSNDLETSEDRQIEFHGLINEMKTRKELNSDQKEIIKYYGLFDGDISKAVQKHIQTTESIAVLRKFYRDFGNEYNHALLAVNPNCPKDILNKLAASIKNKEIVPGVYELTLALAKNPKTSKTVISLVFSTLTASWTNKHGIRNHEMYNKIIDALAKRRKDLTPAQWKYIKDDIEGRDEK